MDGKTWWENKKLSSFEKYYNFIHQISLYVIKMAIKKGSFSDTERFIELWQAEETLEYFIAET